MQVDSSFDEFDAPTLVARLNNLYWMAVNFALEYGLLKLLKALLQIYAKGQSHMFPLCTYPSSQKMYRGIAAY